MTGIGRGVRGLLCALCLSALTCCTPPSTVPELYPDDPKLEELQAANAVVVVWSGFRATIEPTVLTWGRQTHVDLTSLVRASLAKIEGALRSTPTTIDIQAGTVYQIPDVGVGGQTDRSTGEVRVWMDQRSPVPVQTLLRVWLPVSLAHELHHSKRILYGPGYGKTLLEAIVTEGSAEAFVRELYPDSPQMSWVEPLRSDESRVVWTRFMHEKDATDTLDSNTDWFAGGRRGLPRWAGYRLGYAIVRSYLSAHPDVTAAGLATKTADEIFRGSGYRPAA